MNKKTFSLYTTTVCATAITSPGRFVCGLVLAFEMFILMIMEIFFFKTYKNFENRKTLQDNHAFRCSIFSNADKAADSFNFA